MDNEFADLEAELSRLRPRQPSPRLESRLAEILEESPVEAVMPAVNAPATRRGARRVSTGRPGYRSATTWTSWKWANWAVAAALITLMATVSTLTPSRVPAEAGIANMDTEMSAPAETAGLRPVRAQRTVLGSRVDGVIELEDGSAVERVRDFYVDTIEWRDANGNARLRWELPRESVRYVGLAAY